MHLVCSLLLCLALLHMFETFASFALKRRPVGCASDSVWRYVGPCGMATVDCEASCVHNMFNTYPDIMFQVNFEMLDRLLNCRALMPPPQNVHVVCAMLEY